MKSNSLAQSELPITEAQAAELLGIAPATLRRWRCVGRGPNFLKLSPSPRGRVRYLPSAVLQWREAHEMHLDQDRETT